MKFNEAKDRITISDPDNLDLAFKVVTASRYADEADEKKKKPLHPDPPQVSLPWEFGPAASRGLMSALERAAEDNEGKLDVTPETRSLAAHKVALLNEQLGEQKDEGLIGRLAMALTKFNIPLGRF